MKIHKEINNLEIVDLLKAVAASYKIKDASKNRFRIIAYERAADAIEHLSSEAKDLWDEGKLEEVAGIGESIASHLGEMFETGKSKHFEKVMKGIPIATFELIKVSGIGPKTAIMLVKELQISQRRPLLELEKAAKAGKIAKIEGFGENSENTILKSINELKGRDKRLLLPYAEKIAGQVILWLKKDRDVVSADSLGSLRRKASTIGDVDIAVATNNPHRVINHFCKYPNKNRVLEKGEKTASIILPGNNQVDLMVADPNEYGATLQHFTGSKHHNIALRAYALKKGMSLSEYGIKRNVKGQKSLRVGDSQELETKVKSFETEEDFYKYLRMKWIPPELREDAGEIEAARNKKLPNLVNLKDIRADLQIHSDFDIQTSHDLGLSSIADIVKKANELGYQYIAFTEHNPSKSRHKDKQMISLLKKKQEEVDKINYSLVKNSKHVTGKKDYSVQKVFNSLEIDILPDGKLAIPEKGLDLLDFALVSIHSSFKQSKSDMTRRVLNALSHPKVKIFAHPTARKIGKREGVELDWSKIFDFCKNHNKWVEVNADPMRLDLPDFLVREAVNAKVKLTLGTDAHHIDAMDNMKYGVYVAKRGWAEKNDIINTKSLEDFEKMLE